MSISSTIVQRADIRFHEAASVLRPFVGCFWVVEAEPGATIRVVPDGSTAVSVRIAMGARREWILRGPLLRPDDRRFRSRTTLVGIRLRPGVAFLVSGLPADRIIDRRIRLRTVPACQAWASEPPPADPLACIDVLQRVLVGRLAGASLDPIVASALCTIDREGGRLRVAELAARCGVSARHLNRLMRLWVGFGPKRVANVVRFQASLEQMDRSPGQAAAALASETGYFDQSHLSNDLSRYAGATPRHLTSTSVADFSKTRCDDRP